MKALFSYNINSKTHISFFIPTLSALLTTVNKSRPIQYIANYINRKQLRENMNSITFLGTAGDSITYGKQYRASGGIVISIDGIQILLDPGPGSIVKAHQFKMPIREITAILLSNKTVLRSNDINAVIQGMTYQGLDKKGVLITKKEFSNIITDESKNCLERFIFLDPGQKVGINNLEIHTQELINTGALGFKIIGKDIIVSYISDTDYSEELIKQFSTTNVLIINCKNPRTIKEKGALNTDDCIKIVEKIKPALTIITGFGIKMLEQNPLIESRTIQRTTGQQVIAAKDGLIINPNSYSAKNYQLRLKNYYA